MAKIKTSTGGEIGFSREHLILVLIQANRKRYCPIAARIIAELSAMAD